MKQLTTRKEIITLTRASVVNMGIQFFMPILLVRFLDQTSFGNYRLFWLLGNTVMSFALLGVPNSLLYFLPRTSTEEGKKKYVDQTILYISCVAFFFAVIMSPWSPLFPAKFNLLKDQGSIIPIFLFFWVLSSIVEVLPNADLKYSWQAGSIIILAFFRLCIVAGTAVLTRDVEKVYMAICLFVVVRCAILFYYYFRYYGFSSPKFSFNSLSKQLKYAIPFGIGGTLYNLRTQAESWVVAFLFLPGQYAVFANAVSFLPFVNVIRQPISRVVMPKMSALQAEGDIKQLLSLNNKANVVAAGVLFPALSFLFAFSPQVITLLFTETYIEGANVLRIYTVGMARIVIDVASLLLVFNQGKFVMITSGSLIFFSVLGSYWGAAFWGLSGAACGSVLSLYAGAVVTFFRAARISNTPLRCLQDWGSMFSILLISIFSATITWLVAVYFFIGLSEFLLLVTCGCIFTILYFLSLQLAGYGWVIGIYLGKNKWQHEMR